MDANVGDIVLIGNLGEYKHGTSLDEKKKYIVSSKNLVLRNNKTLLGYTYSIIDQKIYTEAYLEYNKKVKAFRLLTESDKQALKRYNSVKVKVNNEEVAIEFYDLNTKKTNLSQKTLRQHNISDFNILYVNPSEETYKKHIFKHSI